jgi:putative membrane-bound dehydrogenase-like protein
MNAGSFVGRLAACAVLILCRPAGAAAPGEASPLATPADLEATLFAAEPLLSSPTNIDVDSRGRVWVCEVTNYRAKKDTRREGDRILVLEDTDGDGRADKRTVFHQGRDVDSALGICVLGEGPGRRVIVSCAPNVFVFHDDDGDLVADRCEPLFTKTGQPQHDHSVHAFTVGPDGRWYFNFGNTGRTVHDKDGRPIVDRFGLTVNDAGRPYRQGMAFRFRPATGGGVGVGDFEVLGHNFRNPYELAVDSFGTLWQSDNDDDGNASVRINFVMEHGNYGYQDELSGAGWRTGRTNLEPEVPRQHWRQNDPGVVPNMLVTGAGSPTGICVYEGTLLPERFRGAVVHCDAGPNVVRAYRTTAAGAGYEAVIEPIADGATDKWFRPSDVCVAPDGSLLVADWHDPGVGGHGMGDVEKGRIYRIAPRGATWAVPALDLRTLEAAVAALASPSLCVRAMALERLAREPDDAAIHLAGAYEAAPHARLKARLAWAIAAVAPEHADEAVTELVAEADADLRVVALRVCRAVHGIGAGRLADPTKLVALVARLAADESPAVRREAAVALKGIGGAAADAAWAALAARHRAGDRWELEALGIGADGLPGDRQWDGRLAAWAAQAGDGWKAPAGRALVWRSRAAGTAAMLLQLIADPAVQAPEALALVRALDFQEAGRVRVAIVAALPGFTAAEEKQRPILPELVLRLDRGDAADPAIAARVAEAIDLVGPTQRFIDLVRKFAVADRAGELVRLAATADTAEPLAASAVAAVLELDRGGELQALAQGNDAAGPRVVAALGAGGQPQAVAMLCGLLADAGTSETCKPGIVKALARSQTGAGRLVEIAKEGGLVGPLPQVAALAIAACPWADLRRQAAGVLPLPAAKGGEKLPPLAELRARQGSADRGRGVFAEAGTCAKCHVVGGQGRSVGPNLDGIGTKLPRETLYEAILAPSAAISHSYETYTALLDDGRSVTGLLVSQSPQEVVIKGADGIDATVAADTVEELVRQPVSLMPADLAAMLSADQLVDLVAYLETLKAAP